MLRKPGLALAVTLLLCGCMGEESKGPFTAADLQRVVLQPEDLTGPWSLFDEGPQARADAPPGVRADPARFGRAGGWKARYRRSGTAQTRGPLVIESRADLFKADSGAEKDFAAVQNDLEKGTLLGASAETLDPPELGDEAVVVTLRQAALRYYLVAWRQDNVTALIFLNGFDRRTTVRDALELAHKQQRRIVAAR